MRDSIWCPQCNKTDKTEDRHRSVVKNNFIHCGDCDLQIVRLADEGHCVACDRYIPDRDRCENCGQKVCGRHMEKRNVMGFPIYGCPVCFGLSMPRKEWMKDEEKGDYTQFRFVWNKEKGWYEWDGDLSKCYFDRVRLPRMKEQAARFKKELERYDKEEGKGEYEHLSFYFQGKDLTEERIQKIKNYVQRVENYT